MESIDTFVESLQLRPGRLTWDFARSPVEVEPLLPDGLTSRLRLITPLTGKLLFRSACGGHETRLCVGGGALLRETGAHYGPLGEGESELRKQAQVFDLELRLSTEPAAPLLAALPSVMMLSDDVVASGWQKWAYEILDEAQLARVGSGTALVAFTQLLVMALLRQYLIPRSEFSTLLASIGDAQIRRSVGLLHKRFEHRWTLQQLAQEVGLSRSALVKRFRSLTGCSPMGYLLQVRMDRAEELLDRGGLSTAQIAVRVGYSSAASLQRALRKSRRSGQSQ